MANQTGFTLESNYEYVLGEVTGKILDLEMVINKPGDFIQLDLIHIAEEMVETAKYFAQMHGFRPGGRIVSNIEYDRGQIGNGRIVLRDPAKNDRQQYIAGHFEFGYHTKSGRFREATPFLRPAMRAVQQASIGRLTSAALEFSGFSGGMKQPVFNKHGTLGNNNARIRAFYKESGYTVKGLEKKLGDGKHISENLGKSYSINRWTDSKTGFNVYSTDKGPVKQRWDSPYTSYNSYKMSRISKNWDY